VVIYRTLPRYISWTVFGIDHLLLGRCRKKFSFQQKAKAKLSTSPMAFFNITNQNKSIQQQKNMQRFFLETPNKQIPTKNGV